MMLWLNPSDLQRFYHRNQLIKLHVCDNFIHFVTVHYYGISIKGSTSIISMLICLRLFIINVFQVRKL